MWILDAVEHEDQRRPRAPDEVFDVVLAALVYVRDHALMHASARLARKHVVRDPLGRDPMGRRERQQLAHTVVVSPRNPQGLHPACTEAPQGLD